LINDITSELTNDIHIDIFPFENNNGILTNVDPRFTLNESIKCNFIYNENDLFPLKPYKFYNILEVSIPNNVKCILKENILSDFENIACFEIDGKIHEYPLTTQFFA
jgi:hypothetical protein